MGIRYDVPPGGGSSSSSTAVTARIHMRRVRGHISHVVEGRPVMQAL